MRAPLLISAAFCAMTALAHAEPGGVSSVSGPSVTEGRTSFELRTSVYDGGALDDGWQYRAQAGHGFTDFWNAMLILRASQPDGEDAELDSIGLENKFDITATRDWPVHLGVQFEYKLGLNDNDDEVEFKLIGEREIGDLTLRANLIGGRTLTSGADWEAAYSARAIWETSDTFAIGAELYGEPEIDAAYIGPRAEFGFGETTLSVSYLAGLDEASADGQFRLALEFAR